MSSVPSSSTEGAVASHVANGVGTIEFGHPKGNSLPATILRELADGIERLGARQDVRVIVLRSSGDGAFCGGASFDELTSIRDVGAGKEFFMGFARVILAMVRAPRPVITRVHGRAVGGGVGVIAASDYAMAASSASLRLSELAVGIGPFVVGPAIEHRIGSGAFAAMAIDADWRDAAWGERQGLYARVFESIGDLDAAVDALAQKLAASNPEALTAIKRATWAGTDDWPRLLEERAQISGRLVLSDYTRDAIAAFRKR